MIHVICWSTAVTVMFCAFIYGVVQYNLEEIKQEAFMVKACADAGGEFQKTWNNRNQCLRPKAIK